MNLQLFATLKNYNFKNLPRDIFPALSLPPCRFLFPWDMHRSRDCRQYMACMVLCSRFFYLPCFPHHRSLSLEWMRLRRHW